MITIPLPFKDTFFHCCTFESDEKWKVYPMWQNLDWVFVTGVSFELLGKGINFVVVWHKGVYRK